MIAGRLRSDRGRDALALAALAAASIVAVFQVALLGKLPDHFDFWLQEYVHLGLLHRALHAGEVPLWNPQLVGGTPHLADPQAAVLYPFTTLPLLLVAPDLVARVSIPLHYLLAGAGTYALARSFRLSRSAALAAGFCYALAPHFAPIEMATYLQQSGAWAPLVLWALHTAFIRRSAGWFAAAGALWGLQLLRGYPQTWYFTGLLAGLFWLLLLSREVAHPAGRAQWRTRWWVLPAAVLVPVVAVTLAAGQLLPSLELLGQSHRAETFTLSEAAGRGRITLTNLLGGAGPDAEVSGAFPGGVALGLALAAALYARGPVLRIALVLAGVGIGLVLGSGAPLWGWTYTLVPGFRLWHMPHRALFMWSLPLALMAGLGLDALRSRPQLRPLAVVTATAIAAVLLLAGTGSDVPEAARAGALHLSIGLALVPALAGLGRLPAAATRVAPMVPVALGLAVPVDLLAHSLPRLYGKFYPPHTVYEAPEAARWLMDRARDGAGARFASSQYAEPVNALGDPHVQDNRRIAFLPPNVSALYPSLDAAQGYLAIRLERSGTFFDSINDLGAAPRVLSVYDPRSRLTDLLGVRYFLTDDVETFPSTIGGGQSLTSAIGPAAIRIAGPQTALRLEVRSSLGDSLDVPDGDEVARIVVRFAGGASATLPVRSGEHTAEWLYDAPQVAGRVLHRKAPVAASSGSGAGRAHVYRATYDLGSLARQPVSEIQLEATRPGVRWNVERVILHIALAERFRPVHRATGVRIWENDNALPFAWWVPGFVHVPGDETLELLSAGRYDPRATALAREVIPQLNAVGAPTTADGSSVSVRRRTFNTLSLDVIGPANGLVVINQTAAPGWRARVDGQPAQLYEANGIQQALYVPAGTHRVDLEYLPGSVQAGLAVSGAAALALAAWAAFAWRRSRRASGAAVPAAAGAAPGHARREDGDTAAGSAPAPPPKAAPTPAADAPARQRAVR